MLFIQISWYHRLVISPLYPHDILMINVSRFVFHLAAWDDPKVWSKSLLWNPDVVKRTTTIASFYPQQQRHIFLLTTKDRPWFDIQISQWKRAPIDICQVNNWLHLVTRWNYINCGICYPLVNKHRPWKSPGSMLIYWRVTHIHSKPQSYHGMGQRAIIRASPGSPLLQMPWLTPWIMAVFSSFRKRWRFHHHVYQMFTRCLPVTSSYPYPQIST
jgi:hypothetical protein